jgi:hypothetical protein
VPGGRSVAIVSNVGAAGVLAASACDDCGLTVHQPRGSTRRRLHALVPPGGSVTGPVDMTAAVSSAAFRQCLELLATDEGVDAVIAIVLPTAATGDLTEAIQQADVPVPLAAVVLDQAESPRLLDGAGGRRIPAYDGPEAPAGALARAAAYGEWQAEPKGEIPAFPEITAGPARELVYRYLDATPGGGWLTAGDVTALLACYGIAPVPVSPVLSPEEAITEPGETCLSAGVTDDHVFGPLIVLGPAGLDEDRATRLAPLTSTDADKLISSAGAMAQSRGHSGATAAELPPMARHALRGLLLRLSRLAEDLPEITEVRLSPVIVRPDGALITGARIKARSCEPEDPYLRRLR